MKRLRLRQKLKRKVQGIHFCVNGLEGERMKEKGRWWCGWNRRVRVKFTPSKHLRSNYESCFCRKKSVRERSKLFISHSHITTTFQPSSLSFLYCSLSLLIVLLNFFSQYAMFETGIDACSHPGWRCQKQPFTKTTVLILGRTMSGFPGKSFRCNRNL